MKLIHTADWHLGDNFHGFDRAVEHQHFLNWLQQVVNDEQPDALLVAGDVFDNANPSAQAEELLYAFLADITRKNPQLKIIITAGNHDSGRRLQAPASLLRNFNVEVRGVVEYDEKERPQLDKLLVPIFSPETDSADASPEAVVLAIPYLRAGDYSNAEGISKGIRDFINQLARLARKKYGKQVPLVVMAHLYAAGSEIALNEHSERLVVGGEDCVDITGLDREAAYVALGHIHKAQQVGGQDRMAFYAGSPIPMSFAEIDYQHSVNKVFIGPTGGIMIDQIVYNPPRRLVSIPRHGAGSVELVLKEIDKLPARKKIPAEQWPYVEIKLSEKQPNPATQNEILNALAEKAASLCRLQRIAPIADKQNNPRRLNSLDQLRNISPLDIALDAYNQATGEEMDDELISRFNTITHKAIHNPQKL